MADNRPFLGVVLMLGFCILIPVSDALAKILGATLPVMLIVLVRVATQGLLLVPLSRAVERRFWPGRRHLGAIVLRTLLYIGGLSTMILALRYLPLADAVAIAFVMPFIMLILGHWFLGEEVGARRIGACVVGFAGTLMVIQPSFQEVGAAALLPLCVAVLFALFMLVTRHLSQAVKPIAMQALSGLIACAILVPLLGLGTRLGWADLSFAPVTGAEAVMLAGMALIGTVAHLLMTWSLKFAPSATVAPMQYLEIPFATAVGFLVFGDLPDGLAATGIVVTMAAGLYVILRERRRPAPAPQAEASPILRGDRPAP
ncbi:MAG: DMT family transporter [Pseudomonadota bacterium]